MMPFVFSSYRALPSLPFCGKIRFGPDEQMSSQSVGGQPDPTSLCPCTGSAPSHLGCPLELGGAPITEQGSKVHNLFKRGSGAGAKGQGQPNDERGSPA